MMFFSLFDALAVCMTSVENVAGETSSFTGFAALHTAMESEYMYLVVGIFASILFMGDYSSGSIRQIIGKGVSRGKYVLGTLFPVYFFSLILLLVTGSVSFLAATVFGDGVGNVPAQEWIWLVVANLIFVFMFTAFVMMVASYFRKISVTLIIALLTPSILAAFSDGVKYFSGKRWGLDPSSQLSKVIAVDAAFFDRLIPALIYLGIGCVFTYLSIMIVRKRDL